MQFWPSFDESPRNASTDGTDGMERWLSLVQSLGLDVKRVVLRMPEAKFAPRDRLPEGDKERSLLAPIGDTGELARGRPAPADVSFCWRHEAGSSLVERNSFALEPRHRRQLTELPLDTASSASRKPSDA